MTPINPNTVTPVSNLPRVRWQEQEDGKPSGWRRGYIAYQDARMTIAIDDLRDVRVPLMPGEYELDGARDDNGVLIDIPAERVSVE